MTNIYLHKTATILTTTIKSELASIPRIHLVVLLHASARHTINNRIPPGIHFSNCQRNSQKRKGHHNPKPQNNIEDNRIVLGVRLGQIQLYLLQCQNGIKTVRNFWESTSSALVVAKMLRVRLVWLASLAIILTSTLP